MDILKRQDIENMASSFKNVKEELKNIPEVDKPVLEFITSIEEDVISTNESSDYYRGMLNGIALGFGMPKDIMDNQDSFNVTLGTLLGIVSDRLLKIG